nr:MAG TPA: hypothetical protein [Caudoviricetes sp.]
MFPTISTTYNNVRGIEHAGVFPSDSSYRGQIYCYSLFPYL